jgi:hypothetical protein
MQSKNQNRETLAESLVKADRSLTPSKNSKQPITKKIP